MFRHIFSLIFISCAINCACFNVNFHEFYGAQLEPFNTAVQKRQMVQFFDQAAFSFNGLEKVESVPVPFPIDICILLLNGVKYAVSLHRNKIGERHFTIYKYLNENYKEVYTTAMPNAIAMDCKTLDAKGYIALALNLTQPIENARDGSPIYQLSADDRLRAVQFFATTNLYSIYLRTTGNDLYMLQTFQNSRISSNSSSSGGSGSGIDIASATNQQRCPYYKWSGTTFTLLGRIPCSNARHVEPFAINYENYVAVANFADPKGRTTTYSEIYKFVEERKRFQLVQKIRTYGAVDVRYFNAPLDEVTRRHFLIFGNSVRRKKSSDNGDDNEADSVFYIYDKGQFVPYQSLPLYAVEQFLPVQNTDAEKFLLLVASKNQETKIYNLNDWKFEPSNVQFTEGAFGRGVSKMRIYQENEKSYLVIANEKMTENDTNIFMPIFKQDEHANALRQQIIDWTKAQIERLSKIDVNKLKKDVEQKLAQNQQPQVNMQIREIPQSNIKTVETNSFVSSKYCFTSDYWQALHYSTLAVNALAEEVKAANVQRIRRFINTTTTTTTTNSESDPFNEFVNIKVDKLIVKNKLSSQKVNGVEALKPTFERVKARKVHVGGELTVNATKLSASAEGTSPKTPPNLTVKHLKINGHLNKQNWNDLQNFTLKREGAHSVQKSAHIHNLVANSVLVKSNDIDGNNLHRLIPIVSGGSDGGDDSRTYVVNQSIRFNVPVKTRELLIHERLNQIHVHKDKLVVLLKHSNVTQVLEAVKRFDNVRILQPITMAVSDGGQMLGSRLQAMAPHQIIHDNLILNGDFTIKGDAIIFESLNVGDLVDMNSQMSTKQSLKSGLDITETLEDVNISFETPLEANNTQLTFINGIDMQQLIKTNYKQLQIIEGEKHFNRTLEVSAGFSEAKYVNGVDIEALSDRLLLKSTNQSIKVPMQFGEIQARSIKANNITLNDKPLSAYVTRSGNQHMPISFTVSNLFAKTLNIEKLQTQGDYIFNKSINDEDIRPPPTAALLLSSNATTSNNTTTTTKPIDLLTPKGKFPNTIFVGNLRLNDGQINGRSVHDIEKKLQQLNADIHFEGNYKFNYNMNISHLEYQGTLNDIPAEEFGHNWLRKNGTQTFTAAQSLSEVDCLKGIQLDDGGMLNGHAIEDFYTKTYWINRNEYIDSMEFTNPLHMQDTLTTATLNGIHLPLDILAANSSLPQILYAGATIHSKLNISDRNGIYNVTTLNGVNLLDLQQFLKAGNGDTLHVEHANFAQSPLYRTLNRHKLSALLDSVWFANENVRLSQHIELANASFEGLLEFEGLVNNVNLHYLKDNYLSLSQPQEIGTELVLADEAQFEGDLTAIDVNLAGLLADNNSNSTTNFDEFVANTLKINGAHEVRADWDIVRARIQGDLENVHINNLNLVNDVIRLDVSCTQIIARKHLDVATIQKLYTTPSSTIKGVPVFDWLHNAVYLRGNQSINGNITVDTVNMYNDLAVLGAVNNISKFSEQTLLLRNIPQTLQGDVYINNLFVEDRRILVNNIENLTVKSVNKQKLDEFYEQQAKVSSMLTVKGNLVFMQSVVVQNYRNEDISSDARSKRNSTSVEDIDGTSRKDVARMPYLQGMFAIVRQLKQALAEPYYLLKHFAVRQKLAIKATKIVNFKLSDKNGLILDMIGIVNKSDNRTEYYKWSTKAIAFQPAMDISWLPKQEAFVDVIALLSSNALHVVELNETAVAYLLSNLNSTLEMLDDIPLSTSLNIGGECCFASKIEPVNESTQIYCLKDQLTIYEKYLIPRKSIKEIVQVSSDKIALLLSRSIEIWRIYPSLNYLQSLPVMNPTKIAAGGSQNHSYLAIHSGKEPDLMNCGVIQVYKSLNSTHFSHMQSLDCIDPIQMSFSKVTASGDLLLYILSHDDEAQSLKILEYEGVKGFKHILGSTTLTDIEAYHILHLDEGTKQLIVLVHEEEIQFVEIVFNRF